PLLVTSCAARIRFPLEERFFHLRLQSDAMAVRWNYAVPTPPGERHRGTLPVARFGRKSQLFRMAPAQSFALSSQTFSTCKISLCEPKGRSPFIIETPSKWMARSHHHGGARTLQCSPHCS